MPTCIISLIIATIIVLLRFIARHRWRNKISTDDILTIIALIIAYAYLIDTILCKQYTFKYSVTQNLEST